MNVITRFGVPKQNFKKIDTFAYWHSMSELNTKVSLTQWMMVLIFYFLIFHWIVELYIALLNLQSEVSTYNFLSSCSNS